MEVVDFQLHEPAVFLDWSGETTEVRDRILTEALLDTLDAVGIDAALLHPAWGGDAWAEALAAQHPSRFASVPMLHGGTSGALRVALHPEAPDIDERIAETFARPGVRAIRLLPSRYMFPGEHEKLVAGVYDRALRACEDHGVPVMILASGGVGALHRVATSFPDLQIVVDHIGLPVPPGDPDDDPRWKALPSVLELAAYENVAVKLCGAVAFSDEAYPFADVWPYLHRLLDAFGPGRLAWASDITRIRGRSGFRPPSKAASGAYRGKHTLMDALALFLYTDELSGDEKAQVLGRTARRLTKWFVEEPGPE